MKNRYSIKKFTFLLFFITLSAIKANQYKADCIIFSYDRPLQLQALLESMETYVTGLGRVDIIFRTSSSDFSLAYQEVKATFPHAHFIQQGAKPKRDFKPLTIKCLKRSPHDYIIFAVDDIIVKDFVDLSHAIAMLEETKSYGFYLRLGYNITFNYPRQIYESLPNLTLIADNVFLWKFTEGGNTWRYPNTVDMTIYNKKTVIEDFEKMPFNNPNTLEAHWHKKSSKVRNKTGLCYRTSKVVNLPLNRVQNTFQNRHMNLATPQELLEIFNSGLKIDIATLFKIENISAHMNYNPEFIERN
ncbi:hypothetical protein ACFLYA_00780 [Candidatus Dependentiae bacterium]